MTDEGHESAGKNVPLEKIAECASQAEADADDREEIACDWKELIETPAMAMTEETFAGRVGQRFVIALGQQDVQVEVKEVKHLGEAPDLGGGGPTRAPFSLLFKGHSPRALLPEGIYRLCHEEMGEFELHLRPAQRESTTSQLANPPHLEALFA